MTIIYTPGQVASNTISVVERMRSAESDKVTLGLPAIDENMIPMLPGDLVSVVGRPSMGKTMFLLSLVQKEAEHIAKNEELKDQVVIYCTWEITVEETGLVNIASASNINRNKIVWGKIDDSEMVELRKAAVEFAKQPLWVIGYSTGDYHMTSGIGLDDVDAAIMEMKDKYNKKVRLLAFDYLQEIEPEKSDDFRKEMIDNVQRVKRLGFKHKCPTVLAVQAKRDVDYREFKLPKYSDGMETSKIEQTSDKVFTLMMPERSGFNVGDEIKQLSYEDGTSVVCVEDGIVIGLGKQRWGRSGMVYYGRIDFNKNRIYDVSRVILRGGM